MPVAKQMTDHYVQDVEAEKKGAPVSVTSISDEIEPDNDLDTVSLKKAFRFAVWASVIMVCFKRKDFECRIFDRRSYLFLADVGIHDHHTYSSVWSIDSV